MTIAILFVFDVKVFFRCLIFRRKLSPRRGMDSLLAASSDLDASALVANLSQMLLDISQETDEIPCPVSSKGRTVSLSPCFPSSGGGGQFSCLVYGNESKITYCCCILDLPVNPVCFQVDCVRR